MQQREGERKDGERLGKGLRANVLQDHGRRMDFRGKGPL